MYSDMPSAEVLCSCVVFPHNDSQLILVPKFCVSLHFIILLLP